MLNVVELGPYFAERLFDHALTVHLGKWNEQLDGIAGCKTFLPFRQVRDNFIRLSGTVLLKAARKKCTGKCKVVIKLST